VSDVLTCPKCGVGYIAVLPDLAHGRVGVYPVEGQAVDYDGEGYSVLARCRICGYQWRSGDQRIIDLGYMAFRLGAPEVQP